MIGKTKKIQCGHRAALKSEKINIHGDGSSTRIVLYTCARCGFSCRVEQYVPAPERCRDMVRTPETHRVLPCEHRAVKQSEGVFVSDVGEIQSTSYHCVRCNRVQWEYRHLGGSA